MKKKGYEYIPQFKMVMPCNNLPAVPARDKGTWRRFRACPWTTEFVDGVPDRKLNQFKKDRTLTEKFKKWYSPLMWLLVNKYFKNLQENKYVLYEPSPVTECTRNYQKDSDVYLEFIDEYIEETNNEEDIESINLVYSMFSKWYLEANSEKSPSKKEFMNYITSHTKIKYTKRELLAIKMIAY